MQVFLPAHAAVRRGAVMRTDAQGVPPAVVGTQLVGSPLAPGPREPLAGGRPGRQGRAEAPRIGMEVLCVLGGVEVLCFQAGEGCEGNIHRDGRAHPSCGTRALAE